MKEKKTLQEQYQARKIHPVPALPFRFMTLVSKVLYYKKFDVNFNYHVDLEPYRGTSYVVVGNHASRIDYVYLGLPFFPDTFNYVMGYNEIFRSHLNLVLRAMKIIQKKNFVPDLYAMRQIKRVIKEGGRIIIMPEGMSSISGHNQPSQAGSGQLLKSLGLPVFYSKIQGGYLANTKYNLEERPGHVDVDIDLMFSPEDLKNMSADEIQTRMDELIWQDDYEWNKKHHYSFKSKAGVMAEGMHQLLFWCPKCRSSLNMESKGDILRCKCCGSGITLDEYYDMHPLTEDSVVPETPSVWFDMQRAWVKKQVADSDFKLEEKVQLGVLPKYHLLKNQKTSEIVGEGILTLTREGLSYKGSRDGADYTFFIPSAELPTYGMCTDVSRFYTFVGPEFTEFYPERDSAELWMMATEEIHHLNNGRWKDFPENHPANRRLSKEFLESL